MSQFKSCEYKVTFASINIDLFASPFSLNLLVHWDMIWNIKFYSFVTFNNNRFQPVRVCNCNIKQQFRTINDYLKVYRQLKQKYMYVVKLSNWEIVLMYVYQCAVFMKMYDMKHIAFFQRYVVNWLNIS